MAKHERKYNNKLYTPHKSKPIRVKFLFKTSQRSGSNKTVPEEITKITNTTGEEMTIMNRNSMRLTQLSKIISSLT